MNRTAELRGHPADRHGRGFVDPQPPATFAEALAVLPMARLLERAREATGVDVDRAVARAPLERTMDDLAAMLSPAAEERLE